MAGLETITILIVDDNPDNIFTLSELIREHFEQIQIKEACSGVEALRIVNGDAVDLILLDVQMPELDGFEFTRMIKKRPKTTHIPVIFITAFDPARKLMEKGFDVGGIDYVTKPIDNFQLVYRIKTYIRFIQRERFINQELERKVRERTLELEASRDFLQRMIDNIPAPVFYRNARGEFEVCNRAYEEYTGKPREKIIGKHVYAVWPEEAARFFHETDMKLLSEKQHRVDEVSVLHRDGNMRNLLIYKKLHTKQDGETEGILGIALDITDRKQAENALGRRDAILEAVNHASECFLRFQNWEQHIQVVLEHLARSTDSIQISLMVIESLAEGTLSGIRQYRWNDMTASPVEFPDNLQESPLNRWMEQLRQNRIVQCHHRQCPDEDRALLTRLGLKSLILVPIFVDEQWWGFLAFEGRERDTDADWPQNEIEALKTAADIIGAAVTRQRIDRKLMAAKEAAENASQAKGEFLATVSHELRTPINAILLLAQSLNHAVYGPVSEKQSEVLGHVLTSSRHLLSMINDIIEFSSIDADTLNFFSEHIPVCDLCRERLDAITAQAEEKQITVADDTGSCRTIIFGDRRRIRKILDNLLENALKFTPEGGTVGIEVKEDTEHDQVHMTVWDTGIGIAEADRDKLFQPFVQLDSRLDRAYEGTGLGLVLAYRLAQLHGGSISLASEVGSGSRFTLTLPCTST